jgi:hypothetical protein
VQRELRAERESAESVSAVQADQKQVFAALRDCLSSVSAALQRSRMQAFAAL